MVVEFFEVVVGGFRSFHVLVTTDQSHIQVCESSVDNDGPG